MTLLRRMCWVAAVGINGVAVAVLIYAAWTDSRTHTDVGIDPWFWLLVGGMPTLSLIALLWARR